MRPAATGCNAVGGAVSRFTGRKVSRPTSGPSRLCGHCGAVTILGRGSLSTCPTGEDGGLGGRMASFASRGPSVTSATTFGSALSASFGAASNAVTGRTNGKAGIIGSTDCRRTCYAKVATAGQGANGRTPSRRRIGVTSCISSVCGAGSVRRIACLSLTRPGSGGVSDVSAVRPSGRLRRGSTAVSGRGRSLLAMAFSVCRPSFLASNGRLV